MIPTYDVVPAKGVGRFQLGERVPTGPMDRVDALNSQGTRYGTLWSS